MQGLKSSKGYLRMQTNFVKWYFHSLNIFLNCLKKVFNYKKNIVKQLCAIYGALECSMEHGTMALQNGASVQWATQQATDVSMHALAFYL